ncbi:MAG: 30S ribosomal protein S20 [Alphaproteobacteria bacterium]|nr:30S ribosomal protein S20 [Alphaproteobacteria bacterium]
MANHKSAEKRFRRDEKRRELNHQRIARIRTFIKKVEKAIITGVKVDAQAAFKAAMPEAMKGITKGLLHKNTVSRKLSRLSDRIKALA